MKAKIFTCAIAAGCMLGGIVFGQPSVQLWGTVTCINSNQIELKCDGETWVVKIVPGSTDDQSSLARCKYKGYCHVQVSRRAKKGKPDVDSCSLFDFETDSDS